MSNLVKHIDGREPPSRYSQEAPCPKCAATTASTRFCRESRLPILYSSVGECWVWAGYWEHLHRGCPNCGHEWLQLPLDAPVAELTQERIRERADALQAELESDRRRHAEVSREVGRLAADRAPRRRWWRR